MIDHMRTPLRICISFTLLAGLAGCGADMGPGTGDDGRGGDTGGGLDNQQPNDIDAALQDLGVPTKSSRRQDNKGEELPSDYTPLGASATISQTDELLLLGMQLKVDSPGGEEVLEQTGAFIELADDTTGVVGLSITELFDDKTWQSDDHAPHPGMNGGVSGAAATRTIVAGDVDQDGLDEIMVVFVDLDSPALADQITVEIIDDQADSAEPYQVVIGRATDVREISAATGDFDGDGDADLAVGIRTPDIAEVIFVDNDGGMLQTREDVAYQYTSRLEQNSLTFELATGNIDNDQPDELVVVVNEFRASELDGSSRYWIYDDALTRFETLTADNLVVGQDNGTHIALVADVALGDIDGDGRDEILLAGLTDMSRNGCDSYGHLHVALDDAEDETRPLSSMGDRLIRDTHFQSSGCNSNSHSIVSRKVFVNAFDVDGDGVDEIHAGRRIFEDFTEVEAWTEAGNDQGEWIVPRDEIHRPDTTSAGAISDATGQMATGDFNGDGREDLVIFMQWRSEISVWGVTGPSVDTGTWEKIIGIETQFTNGQSRVFPVVLPCNVDKDGLALKYSEASYKFVFTEPILIAALAAPPCASGIGQNVDACVSAYGVSESQDLGIDGSVTVSAGVFVSLEAKDPFFDIGVGAEASVTATASFSAGRYYTLEETVEYTTGPLEDTVVFTTIPLDQYTYTVVSHPDPEMVGEEIVINLPRSPITLQVEREFYNNHIPEGSFRVESNVFLHTPGAVDSYPTEGDADALIDTGGLGHLGPLGELVDAAGRALGPIADRLLGNGLKTSRVTTVGQGGGQTSTEIAFSQQDSYRAGAEVSYEEKVEVSGGGVTAGTTIGGSVGAGISWGSGSSTVYRGTVGSIDGASFQENVYSFGLFTYIYNYGDPSLQQFEVINYWVDR